MVKVHPLILGPLETNCYIVREDRSSSCVVVDPAASADQILTFAARQGLTIEAVFLTHGHFDHVGAVRDLREATGCTLWMHKGDYNRPGDPMNDYLYPLHDKNLGEIHFCNDGDTIPAAGLTFTVCSTPGHSLGSVCYLTEKTLLSGDTLFAGGCGRTDLPGGNADTIFVSLSDLSELANDIKVYPGHGESTTLAREKKYNPYMR